MRVFFVAISDYTGNSLSIPESLFRFISYIRRMDGLVRFLCEGGYDRLRRATRTHRSDVIVRLCGEVGLRPSEVVTVRPDDVVTVDGTRFLDMGDREAVLPSAVAHALRKYARSVDTEGPLVSVSERRVQMVVKECGAQAADATGNDRFRDVSTRKLRATHAMGLLREGIDPRVVLAVTTYDQLSALEPYLEPAGRGRIVAAFAGGRQPIEQPTQLRRTLSVATDVCDVLAAATAPTEIHDAVCARLADTEGYRFAWAAEATGDGLITRAHAGIERETVDRLVTDHIDHLTAALEERAVRTIDSSTATLVVVPLICGEPPRGLLAIGAVPDEISTGERDLLTVLGAQVSHALAAVERQRRLLADTVTELTFGVDSGEAPLPAAAQALSCTFELNGVVPVEEGVLCYVFARDTTPDAVLDHADTTDAVANGRFVGENNTECLLELTLGRSPIRTLTDTGGRIRSYTVDPRQGRLVGELSTDTDVRAVVNTLTDAFPGVHLKAKQQGERTVTTDTGLSETLTDRQAAVLRSAYFGGYFEWPRDSTAEELADSLDISSPTLHHHLRIAQQKLLRTIIEDA